MVKQKKEKSEENEVLFAFLAVFLSIIGFIIALLVRKENKYVMHYAKQSLVLFIAWLVVWAFSIVPFVGRILGPIATFLLVILWIIGLVYSLSGKERLVPIIGKFAENINL